MEEIINVGRNKKIMAQVLCGETINSVAKTHDLSIPRTREIVYKSAAFLLDIKHSKAFALGLRTLRSPEYIEKITKANRKKECEIVSKFIQDLSNYFQVWSKPLIDLYEAFLNSMPLNKLQNSFGPTSPPKLLQCLNLIRGDLRLMGIKILIDPDTTENPAVLIGKQTLLSPLVEEEDTEVEEEGTETATKELEEKLKKAEDKIAQMELEYNLLNALYEKQRDYTIRANANFSALKAETDTLKSELTALDGTLDTFTGRLKRQLTKSLKSLKSINLK